LNADMSFVHLIAGASPFVQLVMAILILASILAWTVIFAKWRQLRRARAAAEAFELKPGEQAMEAVFAAGFKEFARLKKEGLAPDEIMEGVQRSMRVALGRQMEVLEQHLPFLATVGSTSPYIGLLGTVWGIMNAFRALSGVKQATLAMVAPGIAEALIATALQPHGDRRGPPGRSAPGLPGRVRQHPPTTGAPLMPAPAPRQRRRPMAEINVVPYIDVTLVLLVIFIVTAPLLTQGVQVDLPQAAATPIVPEENKEPLVVTVDAQGRFFLNVGENPEAPVDEGGAAPPAGDAGAGAG